MQLTTQKRQQEEFKRLIEQERRVLIKHSIRVLRDVTLAILAITIPILATAPGWLKG